VAGGTFGLTVLVGHDLSYLMQYIVRAAVQYPHACTYY